MTNDKLLIVIAIYEDVLSYEEVCNATPDLLHVKQMLPQMREFIAEGRIEKTMRWLGFVQGVLWCHRVFTIAQMADHNRESE